MPKIKARSGFTLVEVLIVTLILGFLAALAAPRLQRIRVRSHLAVMAADLRGLSVAQEVRRSIHHAYGTLDALAGEFAPSPGVTIDFRWLQADAYAARAQHPAAAGWECWYVSGKVPPGHSKPVDGASGRVMCVAP